MATYEKMLHWLAEQDLEEYSQFSKTISYQLYIKENKLDLKYYSFQKPAKEIAKMIRDSTEFSTATKAKLLIILDIPIVDKGLLTMLKKEDNKMMLRAINQAIYKFCSRNGEVVFHGTQIRRHSEVQKKRRATASMDSNKNQEPSKRAALEEHSSQNSLSNSQEPSAKKARTRQLLPTFDSASTNQLGLFPIDSDFTSINSRIQENEDYHDRVKENEGMNQKLQIAPNEQYEKATDSDEFPGEDYEVADQIPSQSFEVNAPKSSHEPTPNFTTAEVREEQEPVLKDPKNEVRHPPVEETPLEKLKRLETPTNRKTVFELLRLFVLCLKEFDHLCPDAINHIIRTLKDTLIHFSVFSNGILVKDVFNDFHNLICHMHGNSRFLQYVYDHWNKNVLNRGVNEESITFDLLKMTLIDIILLLPPV